jgi:hypothetical protein
MPPFWQNPDKRAKVAANAVDQLTSSIIDMIKAYLNLLCVLAVCSALGIETMRKETLDNIKLFPDYNHHFIFFNNSVLTEIKPLLEKWTDDIGTSLGTQMSNFTSMTAEAISYPSAILPSRPLFFSSSIAS